MFESINPYSGEPGFRSACWSNDKLEESLRKAGHAYRNYWSSRPIAERQQGVLDLAHQLRGRKKDYARLITDEMGKPIGQSRAEVEKCALLCDFFGRHAHEMLSPVERQFEGKRTRLRWDPLGVILGIMPWNYPFWQVFRFAVPAMLAGNTALLKPATNVGGCGQALADLFRDVFARDDLFQTLFIDHDQIEQVLANPLVQGVALTGSERAGSAVAALAGKHLKKCVMELGGSDPFIVMEDADLDRAAEVGLMARLQNNGQTCIAAKRFILHQSIADAFLEKLVQELERLAAANPNADEATLSVMARKDLKDQLLDQIDRSIAQGGELIFRGEEPDHELAVEPVVLERIDPQSPAFREELFGPVFSVFRVADAEEAVRLANATPFGLGASIWTSDEEKALAMAARLEAGTIAVNQMVASDPRLPFGGVKRSGFGRELGREGIREFTNLKTIVL